MTVDAITHALLVFLFVFGVGTFVNIMRPSRYGHEIQRAVFWVCLTLAIVFAVQCSSQSWCPAPRQVDAAGICR